MDAYFQSIIDRHRHRSDGRLLGEIIAAYDAGVITRRERTALIWGCWSAGRDTTGTLIALLLGLIDEAQEQPTMLGNLDRLGLPWRQAAIQEALRFTPFGVSMRVAVANARFSGCPVQAGQLVALHWDTANRDREVFGPDAHLYRPERRHHPNLAFGHGPHYCLGAPLARTVVDVAAITVYRHLLELHFTAWHRRAGLVDVVDVATAEYDLTAARRAARHPNEQHAGARHAIRR